MRQGRLEEAERLLEGGEWHPTARRLAAVIALARGDTTLAAELGELCSEGAELADPTCVPALELLVMTRLAIGDVPAAREAADRIALIAAGCGLERVEASAALADGRVLAAEGDAGATGRLSRAAELFAVAGLPLEAARAQLELARALSGSAPAAADARGRLAIATFERLGALRTPTRRQACCVASEPPAGGPGPAARPLSPGARARSSGSWPKAARTPRSPSGW